MTAPQSGHFFHKPSGISRFFLPKEAMDRLLKIPMTENDGPAFYQARANSTLGPR
jgi:hypothetical protein